MDVFNKAVEKIKDNDCVGLQQVIKTHSLAIETEDENGMTLLQHACFKGKKDVTQLLLDLGANPNGGHHEHNYTSLHFAALSGSVDICLQLLHSGVNPDALNSVNRTAAQMSAFVGNHQCVSVINNFIPREEVDRYIVSKSDTVEPALPPAVAPALHKFLMQVNLNPVHLLFIIQKHPLLFDNIVKVKNVLESLCDSQMKRNREANEILSLKCHYLCFFMAILAKEVQKHPEKSTIELTTQYAKLLLKVRTSDGFPEFMDNFVRESIRTFPYKETTVFRQLLVNLSNKKEAPLALSMLSSSINGQRGFQDDNSCAACGEEKVPHKCSSCKSVQYCDRNCQKIHWSIHKKDCDKLSKQMNNLKLENKTPTEDEKGA